MTGVETPQVAWRRVAISAGPLGEPGSGVVPASSAAAAFAAAVVAVVDAVAVAAADAAVVVVAVVVDESAAGVDAAVPDGRSHAASVQARVHDADPPSCVVQTQLEIGESGALPGPGPLPPS